MQQQYIYTLRLIPVLQNGANWTDEHNAIVSKHFQYLKQHLEQGTLIMAGRTSPLDETTFGIVIFKATSEEDAQAFMQQDPAVAEGIMTAELFPFYVALSPIEL